MNHFETLDGSLSMMKSRRGISEGLFEESCPLGGWEAETAGAAPWIPWRSASRRSAADCPRQPSQHHYQPQMPAGCETAEAPPWKRLSQVQRRNHEIEG